MLKLIKFKYTLVFTLILFVYSKTIAQQNLPQQVPQDLSNVDLTQIKVDQLTDSQIKEYIQRAQQSGLTQDQIETALRARGFPDIEISKLRQRINSLSTGEKNVGKGYSEVRTREKPISGDLFDVLKTTPEKMIATETQKKLFGFSLFNSQNLTFNPSVNMPTPKDYQLGPGDQIIIDIWGASEQTYQQVISPDGYILITNLGPIYLSGLTIEKATGKVKDRLTKIYSGLSTLNGLKPNTFFQLSLGQVRTNKVNVIGEVRTPGTYDISALATVFNGLYLSGGPSINGSFREIELIRDNKINTVLDVYDFLLEGVQKNNVQLQDQDIIRIKPYLNRVEISGEVKREGIYETKKGETFNDLIRFAGGFSEKAYQSVIKIRRNTDKEQKLIDVSFDDLGIIKPENGDYVIINSILHRFENRVQISGSVYREGEFELTDGLSVLKLIDKADGLTGDANLERATIFRTNEDFTTEAVAFNLRELLKGEKPDILLKREDLVRIISIYDLREEYYVTIDGSVRDPGNYPYMEDMSLGDIILQSGGLLESADISTVEVARRVRNEGQKSVIGEIANIYNFSLNVDLSIKGENERFVLQPFDNIFIRKAPDYQAPIKIRVEGEVIYPGSYLLEKKSERISDLIKRSGGIRVEAYVEGATLIRRTEFYESPSEIENRYKDLLSIRKQLYDKYSYTDNLSMTESEYLRSQRLADLEKNVANYRNRQEDEVSREGVRQRRASIQQLQQRDTTITDIQFNKFETIGINLEQILKTPGSKFDLILQDGDVISIPKQLETVRMRGEFLYPITARYDQRYTFKDYLAQAGGFTEQARRSKAYVIYANGSVDRTRKLFLFANNYPPIKPGTEIIVPAKPQKEPMSTQGWIALTTGIATLALVVKSLIP